MRFEAPRTGYPALSFDMLDRPPRRCRPVVGAFAALPGLGLLQACGGGPASATPSSQAAPAGEEVNFLTVDSGDTIGVFLLGYNNGDSGKAQVRVLGVTACGPETGQGFAAHNAALPIGGQHDGGTERVWLTTEPGSPDTDSSGALLRYVRWRQPGVPGAVAPTGHGELQLRI
jgi:hypothetical protein